MITALTPERLLKPISTVGRALGLQAWLRSANERLGIIRNRHTLGRQYLQGNGIEIGALAHPLLVADGVRVTYLDHLTREQCVQRFPEVDASKLVTPEIIDDGFQLANVLADSQDFLIANHVLEHAPNPYAVLREWCRALRPGGLLFVTVPDVAQCFDRGRSVTPAEHLLADYEADLDPAGKELHRRSLDHYQEWMAVSHDAVLVSHGKPPEHLAPVVARERAMQLWQARSDIHFHTFSPSSFREDLKVFCARLMPEMSLYRYFPLQTEIVALLKKSGG